MTTPQIDLLPLVEAVHSATGRKIHLSTVLRWCMAGRSGHRLESWILGGRRMTTTEAVIRFIDATTQSRTPRGFKDEPKASTDKQRAERIRRAEKALQEQGI